MKELREDMNSNADVNSNADAFRKELENIRRSQEKLENSFAETKAELKALNTRMNNAEEDRIMEITQQGIRNKNKFF